MSWWLLDNECLKVTHRMKGCHLSLLGETWCKIYVRRKTAEGEPELVIKGIESITRAGLQESEGMIKKMGSSAKPMLLVMLSLYYLYQVVLMVLPQ